MSTKITEPGKRKSLFSHWGSNSLHHKPTQGTILQTSALERQLKSLVLNPVVTTFQLILVNQLVADAHDVLIHPVLKLEGRIDLPGSSDPPPTPDALWPVAPAS